MSAAIYDNPATCSREVWRDGRMEILVSLKAMSTRGFRELAMPWFLDTGKWEPGKVVGERLAVRPLNPPLGHP